MKVPTFLLRRLYVKGSLRNTDDGWEFTLRNSIAGGEATGLDSLVVDGVTVPASQTFFGVEGTPVAFSKVDEDHRFGLESGRDVRISVTGDSLAEGTHTVAMGFTVPAIGHIAFDFTDAVA